MDCKTKDGFHLRVFCIGYTYRKAAQVKKTSYATRQQRKLIRAKMVNYLKKKVEDSNIE